MKSQALNALVSLSKSAEGKADNEIQDIAQKVRDVFKGELQQGYHQVNFNASTLPSGVYFYRFESEQFVSVRKMLLIK